VVAEDSLELLGAQNRFGGEKLLKALAAAVGGFEHSLATKRCWGAVIENGIGWDFDGAHFGLGKTIGVVDEVFTLRGPAQFGSLVGEF
jgi:hypothetical protein